jgi:hypothetical protein
MATKTITLEIDAYEKLRGAKLSSRESFSSVVRRARWDDAPSTAAQVLARVRALRDEHPQCFLDDDALGRIERRALDRPVRANTTTEERKRGRP